MYFSYLVQVSHFTDFCNHITSGCGNTHCRDLADFGMGFNAGPPLMSREEFEARKSDLKRKRETERRGER